MAVLSPAEKMAQAVRNAFVMVGIVGIAAIALGGRSLQIPEIHGGNIMTFEQFREFMLAIGNTAIWLAAIYWIVRPLTLVGVDILKARFAEPSGVHSPPQVVDAPHHK